MNEQEVMMLVLQDNLCAANSVVDCLYLTASPIQKNMLLNSLRQNLTNIWLITQGFQRSESMPTRLPEIPSESTRIFTQAQLAKYNGKNRNPAYVAVNGNVYDVTNQAAWGGATHFGLTAGKSYTREFNVCHSGQSILNGLDVVGKMAE